MKNASKTAVIFVALAAFITGLLFPSIGQTEQSPELRNASAEAKIVAAAKNSNTGMIGKVKVDIIPGNGDVLIETNPFIQADTQISATKAKEVAEEYTGKSLKNHDVIYTIKMDSAVVGGPSAGAAMTLATIAAMTKKEVKEDAVITGTITRSGRVGRVGKIPVKAYTAGKNGIKYFYVPEGQAVKVNYEKVVEAERKGFFVYKDVEYKPRKFNISRYTQQNFNMKTEEVESIYEAAEKMLK